LKVPPEKYEIGYGRPPQHTRWKKGQCGNPNRIRKRTPEPVVQMIDEFFAGEIAIIENGISRRVSNFEAVVLQLWTKAMAGNKRAMNVLLKYQEFAASRGGMDDAVVEPVERVIIHVDGREEWLTTR
jgi:hypothetical protein